MSSKSETAELSAPAGTSRKPGLSKKVNVQEMLELSVRGLGPMFDTPHQQFCHRLVRTRAGMAMEGLSPRYTVMTLLGLIELEKAGGRSPFSISTIFDHLLKNTEWPKGGGDFGLLLWLTSVLAPEKVSQVLKRVDLENLLETHTDVRQRQTMELAWLLTGLSYAALSGNSSVGKLAARTYEALTANQGKAGFFGHLGASAGTAGRLRGWMGSFADQVYPILGMTRFSQAFGNREALDRALLCGKGICRVQGPLGQWWWHYDSRSDKVASMYPVFSVHQEAMGPMVLFPLGEATNSDFTEWIYRGLQWIGGTNEMKFDMRDTTHNLVWRRIHPLPESSMKVDVAMSHLGVYRDASRRKMEVLHECRPYELGWLLYAFAAHANDAVNR